MRSLNVGIVGLALVGVASVLPQHASAYASYSVDVDTTTNASLDGTGTVSIVNYYSGVEKSGYVDAGGVSTFTNTTNSVVTGSGVNDILLSGVATGDNSASDAYWSNPNTNVKLPTNANTLGTIVTISGMTADTNLSLDMTLDYLLSTIVTPGSTAYSYFNWTVTYQTRAAGSTQTSAWSNWMPSYNIGGNTTYFGPDSTLFGESNWGAHIGQNGDPASGTDEFSISTLLDDANEYRFRLALEVRGAADSAAVPLPAALPMLGAAMAGLGLFAAKRRKKA